LLTIEKMYLPQNISGGLIPTMYFLYGDRRTYGSYLKKNAVLGERNIKKGFKKAAFIKNVPWI